MKRAVPLPRRLRLVLIVFMAGMAIVLAVIYTTKKAAVLPGEKETLHIDSGAALVLNQMHQTSFKDGIKEWSLDAASARLLKEGDIAEMNDVTAVFLTKDNIKARVTSKTGILNTATHDMTLSGKVEVHYGEMVLTTDKLQYDKKRHIIYSTKAVTILGENSRLAADALEVDLAGGRVVLTGNVKGVFSENFSFDHLLPGLP